MPTAVHTFAITMRWRFKAREYEGVKVCTGNGPHHHKMVNGKLADCECGKSIKRLR